jgi:hypothetical protein
MVKLKRLPDYTWKVPGAAGTWLFLPDEHHAPEKDPNGGVDMHALGCAAQAIGIVKPDGIVRMGDIGEWTSVSPWDKSRQKRPEISRVMDGLNKDLVAVNAGMDLIDYELPSSCKKRILLQGNHEVWIDNMLAQWKNEVGEYLLKPDLGVPGFLNLKQRGYAYVPYGDYARFGHLSAYHGGHFGGQHHANAHIVNLSASVVYAHHHSYQVAKRTKLGVDVHAAWCIGFLGKQRKPFMKGKPTNWSHNFAIVHVERDGTFHMDVVEILNGKCYVYGKKVTG